MGATAVASRYLPSYTRFNPRARDGRDFIKTLLFRLNNVSIHAPVMGATLPGVTMAA
tara:strand:+ start:5027 stop:5197 length:171 start_codon:yes stop_codon:yes gene_type:complete